MSILSNEQPISFDCAAQRLLGILHSPGNAIGDTGLLLVVGGPQYRVGSHRQFVLLARWLAATGIPVFRFDYRGMGDSSGERRDFSDISDDIHAAIATFLEHATGVRQVVLWGLCDAATANAFYAVSDPRVIGQIALNPWVRTDEGEAQAFIKHYYFQRVLSPAFWRKVVARQFDIGRAVRDFVRKLGQSRAAGISSQQDNRPLPPRLRDAQLAYTGPTLLILSGQDLTAKEYEMRVAESAEWQRWMTSYRVTLARLAEADHSFSRALWRDQVAALSGDWIVRHFGPDAGSDQDL